MAFVLAWLVLGLICLLRTLDWLSLSRDSLDNMLRTFAIARTTTPSLEITEGSSENGKISSSRNGRQLQFVTAAIIFRVSYVVLCVAAVGRYTKLQSTSIKYYKTVHRTDHYCGFMAESTRRS